MRTLSALMFLLLASGCRTAMVVPLERAHAHNDYRHERPLLDALSHGFCSVEADIFLVDGKLLVAHERSELDPGRGLRGLYLDLLLERVRRHGGRVYPEGPEFTLLIDIKDDGVKTYEALHDVLSNYREMLTTVEDGRRDVKAVTVVISGNRAWERIAAESPRYAAIDGRLPDLDSARAVHLMPLISDRWGSHFRWRGDGPFPEEEREKLRGVVRQAHAKGRRVRLWATPEKTSVWAELLAAGVDHINTDELQSLRDFLLEAKDGVK